MTKTDFLEVAAAATEPGSFRVVYADCFLSCNTTWNPNARRYAVAWVPDAVAPDRFVGTPYEATTYDRNRMRLVYADTGRRTKYGHKVTAPVTRERPEAAKRVANELNAAVAALDAKLMDDFVNG